MIPRGKGDGVLAGLFKSLFGRRVPTVATSLSDTGSYVAACRRAASDPAAFDNFRRDPHYTRILEHVSAAQGRAYLELIARDDEIRDAIEVFRPNDLHGNPQRIDYPGVGLFSPSTLRYVKVLADLKFHFGSLDGMRICEIGVGYGGQCRIINAFYRPAGYCLVDLAPALDLARRYLGNFTLGCALSFRTLEAFDGAGFDLVISNYAFTELARPVQDAYLSKVIMKAPRGYITYNEISPPGFQSYRAAELTAMIPGARRLEEEPLTHPRNCLIVWGV